MPLDRADTATGLGRFWTPERIALAGLLVFSLLIRMLYLGSIPSNLMCDELSNLRNILKIKLGRADRTAFFGFDWKPMPAMSIHLQYWTMKLLGDTVFVSRFLTALLTALSLVPFYYLAKEFASKQAAMTAAFLHSTNIWFLNLSRNSWENGHVCLYGNLAFLFLLLGLRRRRLLYFLLSGFSACLGLYGYFAGFLIIVIILAYSPFALWWGREAWRQVILGYALLVVVCFGLYIPQGIVYWRNFRVGQGRTDSVRLDKARLPYKGETELPRIIWVQIRNCVPMFWRGTNNATRYAPGHEPMVAFLPGIFLAVGMFASLFHFRKRFFAWLAFLIPFVVTQILTVKTPDGARGVGMLPPLFIFVAMGLDVVSQHWYVGRFHKVPSVLILMVVVTAVHDFLGYYDYINDEGTLGVRGPSVEVEDYPQWAKQKMDELQGRSKVKRQPVDRSVPEARRERQIGLWDPQWTWKASGKDMGSGYRPRHEGREGILVTHPVSPKEPSVLTRQAVLEPGKQYALKVSVTNYHDWKSDWVFRAFVDDRKIAERRVATGRKGEWVDLEYDLSPWAGGTVTIRLENAANGWTYEGGYWDYATIEEIP